MARIDISRLLYKGRTYLRLQHNQVSSNQVQATLDRNGNITFGQSLHFLS
jgi:hypothetical protein